MGNTDYDTSLWLHLAMSINRFCILLLAVLFSWTSRFLEIFFCKNDGKSSYRSGFEKKVHSPLQ